MDTVPVIKWHWYVANDFVRGFLNPLLFFFFFTKTRFLNRAAPTAPTCCTTVQLTLPVIVNNSHLYCLVDFFLLVIGKLLLFTYLYFSRSKSCLIVLFVFFGDVEQKYDITSIQTNVCHTFSDISHII